MASYFRLGAASATNDITGMMPNASVVSRLQGTTLTITSPSSNQVVTFNGSAFVNAAISNSMVSGITTLNSLTSIGTITTGTWNATTIANTYGGTGSTANFVQGGIAYGMSTSMLSTTAAGTSGEILQSAGTGTPTWTSSPTLSSLTISSGGNITVSGGGTLTGLIANPVNASDAASKAYVDNATAGLSWKATAAYATAAALPANTYSNGASGVGATLTATAVGVLTVDGTAISTLGTRILVKDEATAANNGIYTMTTVGTGGVAYVLTRATDADLSSELNNAALFVTNGTANMGVAFTQTTAMPTMGSSSIVFVQFAGATIYTAGTGLSLSGSQFNLVTPVASSNGGTGVANSFNITVGGALTTAGPLITSGANSLTLTTTGTTNVTFPLSGTLVNSAVATLSSLTSIGTITTGTWNASTIAAPYGGTGQSVYVIGDLLYASSTSALSRLADVATGSVLLSGGVGVAPSWGAVNLTSAVTGVLPSANGGTGVNNSFNITLGGALTTGSTLSTTGAFSTGGAFSTAGTLTTAGNFTTSGAFPLTLTTTASTSVTLPTSGTLVNTAVATLSSLSSVGTITTGTWNATPVAAPYGGTGQSVYVIGDVLYADSTSTLARLADVATGSALISGGIGAAPSWGKISLTTAVSGTLPAPNGGTGNSVYAVGDLLYANTTSTLSRLADVATGSVLLSGGVGVAPSYGQVNLATAVTGVLPPANGGTGVSNSFTITVGGNFSSSSTVSFTGAVSTAGAFTTSGAFPMTLTATASTSVTLPTSGTLVNTAVATLSSLSSVGTITTGTWNASTIAAIYGGTGQSVYAVGDLLYASSTSALSRLADVAVGSVLLSGGVGAAPSYGQVNLTSAVTGVLPSANGGTGVNNSFNITLGGAISTASSFTTSGANALTLTTTGATNVTLPTTGTLVNTAVTTLSSLSSVGTITTGTWNATPVSAPYGGTGQSVYAVGDLLYASSTSALSRLADVAAGSVLVSGGVGAAPIYTATPNVTNVQFNSGGSTCTLPSVICPNNYYAAQAGVPIGGLYRSQLSSNPNNTTVATLTTASIVGFTLTITAITGTVAIGSIIAGGGTSANTYITAFGTGSGGTGTYTVSNSQTTTPTSATTSTDYPDIIYVRTA